ncbi:hypothetical protein RIR_jg41657.t1 [Rhizophagus irregularis DAOM 181602=DAOM 197198]|nr:hypothetical protein RIR_jg41657.t1 [Rhizophagus irregularis DAOM 181602=DAOM 197198]CAB4488975.1 unnamed protein product [Rhizophagus irregularis]
MAPNKRSLERSLAIFGRDRSQYSYNLVDSNTKDISNVAHGPENAIYVHTLVGDMSGNSYQVVVYNNNRGYSSRKGNMD